MGKNIVSIKSTTIQKTPKLMKLKKKKKNILGKVLGYLKSDTYLFAPLISRSHHRLIPLTSSSTGVERANPVIKKNPNPKVVEKLVDYLMSDYHMYASLVVQEPCVDADKCPSSPGEKEKAKTDMNNRVEEVMKNVTNETRVPKHQTNGFSIETMRLDNGYSFGKTTGVKHTLLQKETVKHVIQQKRRLSSRRGKTKQDDGREFAVNM